MKNFSQNKYRRLIVLVVLSFVLLAVAETVMARAGGGGGFGGGSSGGGFGGGFGGSGSRSGNGAGFVNLIFYLLIVRPEIGIPLALVMIIVFTLSWLKGHSAHMTRTIRKANAPQPQILMKRNEVALKKRDPGFSRLTLEGRLEKGFSKIQEAWAAQNMHPVRHIISDGIFERFSTQIEIQKSSKIRNLVSDMKILKVQTVGIESDPFFDTVHIKITASAVDYFVNHETGKRIYGSNRPEVFTEIWSLLRRPGVRTLNKPGLFEGFCPNCATPLDISDKTECPSCDALVNSGDYDWVLAEISQESEWKFTSRAEIEGFAELSAKDPAFNIQHIEDRASVMFFRWIAAEFFADTKYLTKLASDEFMEKYSRDFKTLEDGKHKFPADAAVGAVDVYKIISGDDFDSVNVRVRWSGHYEKKEIPSLVSPDFEKSRVYTHEFKLIRRAGVKTSAKNVLTSVHCPGCGAPEIKSDTGYCEYCHTPLNDGGRDWVLNDIQPFMVKTPIHPDSYVREEKSPKNPLEKGSLLSAADNESIIFCCVNLMQADGVIDPKEEELLKSMAASKGISEEKLKMIINSVSANEVEISLPNTMAGASEFLRCMVLMCLMDGKVTTEERTLLNNLATKMGYSDIDIRQMIKKERLQLFKAAKKAKARQQA